MKNSLNLSNTWLIDGTSKLCVEIFDQVYAIQIELQGFAPTFVCVLLPNETDKSRNVEAVRHREGVAKTTIGEEGWHYGLQTYCSGSIPNFWLLLRNLEKVLKMQLL